MPQLKHEPILCHHQSLILPFSFPFYDSMQTEESAGGGGTSSEQNFEEEMMKLMQDAQEELKKDEEGLKRDAELAVRLAKLNTKTSGTLVKNITNHCGIIITESK